MKKPRKPCVECGGVLTGLRTRFCQNSCARAYDEKRRQAKYALIKIHLKDKECVVCKKKYPPRTSRQLACSKHCGIILSNSKRKKKVPSIQDNSAWETSSVIKQHYVTQEITEEVTMLSNSEFSNEIQEYLSSGGKVTKISPQIAGATPSVGVALKLGGWSVESLQGFGIEIDLMEETNPDLVGLFVK